MSSVSFEALSANSPFAELRGFVKANMLNRGGIPLKATSKAALYAQIVESWKTHTQAVSREPEPAVSHEPEPSVSHEPEPAVSREPEPAVSREPEPAVSRERTPNEPFLVMADTLFPDRLDTLKTQYPFFNGLDQELIFARVNRHIRDNRLLDGTLLYVGTTSDDPEQGMMVVKNGQAGWLKVNGRPEHGEFPPVVYRKVIAHGAVYDPDLTQSREVDRRRMHVALVHSDRPTPTLPVSVHRRRWQHNPVQLAHADVVLHPPLKHSPRKRWKHQAVTMFNGVKLYPKPKLKQSSAWNVMHVPRA